MAPHRRRPPTGAAPAAPDAAHATGRMTRMCYAAGMTRHRLVLALLGLATATVMATSLVAPVRAATTTGKSGGAWSASAKGHPEVLPFIEDDYDRALAVAKTRHLPLFIDSWAPW